MNGFLPTTHLSMPAPLDRHGHGVAGTPRGARFASVKAVAAVLLAMVVAGCQEMPAVRDFARTASTAGNTSVAADFADSVARQKRVQPTSQAANLDALAAARKTRRAKFEATQAVLSAYFVALSDLAANQIPSDADYNALATPLQAESFIGDGDAAANHRTAAAAVDLTRMLSKSSMDWRQTRINNVIRAAEPAVQTVLAGMNDVLAADFELALKDDDESLRQNVEKPLAALEKSDPQSGASTLARQLLADQQEALSRRQATLKTGSQILKTIAAGHAELALNADRLTDSAFTTRLSEITKQLESLQAQLKNY